MIKKIFLGGIANLLAIFITMAVAVTRSSLAVRYLPATESGVWFLFWNIIAVVSFCDLGLSPTLSREIGFASKKREISLRLSNLFYTTRRVIHFVSLIVLLLLVCIGYFYFYHLPLGSKQMEQVLYAFALFSVALIIQFQSNPYLAVIYGMGNIATERYIRTAGPALGLLVSVFLVIKQGYGLFGLTVGYICQTCFVYILARYFFNKKIHLREIGGYLKVVLKRILAPSVQWTIIEIGAILVLQSSNFIIGYLIGVKHVPQFAVLLQVAMIILTMAGIVCYVTTPFIARAKGKNDIQTIHHFFTIAVRISTAIGIVLAIFFYFFINPITHIWLGPDFVVNHTALLILLTSIIFETHHVSCTVVTMATGYIKFAGVVITAGILNVILSFIFIHFFGILGAALSILISQLLTNNWYSVVLSLRNLQLSFKQYRVKVLVPLILFFIYILLVVVCMHYLLANKMGPYVQLTTAVVSIGSMAFIGAWFFLLSADEKGFIKLRMRGILHV